MFYFISLLPLLCVGCFTPAGSSNEFAHHEVSSGNNLSIKNVEENHDSKNEATNLKRAYFGRMNWIDFDIVQTFVTIKGHTSEFQKDASLRISVSGSKSLANVAEFKDFCIEKTYETNKNFLGVIGDALIYINPLNWSIAQRIAFNRLNELVTKIENNYTIKQKKLEISADFLSADEKSSLINAYFLYKFDELDILRLNLFNPLIGPDQETSSLLIRLFCGMAEHKASILYTFHDEQENEMLVRVNGVVFEDISY